MRDRKGRRRASHFAVLAAGLMLVVASACATNPGDPSPTAPSESALSTAYAAWSQSSGTLLCDPSDAQTALCSGLAAGDACTLTSTDGA
jgi:hypothetical protein